VTIRRSGANDDESPLLTPVHARDLTAASPRERRSRRRRVPRRRGGS
jgi:hypothetical protein